MRRAGEKRGRKALLPPPSEVPRPIEDPTEDVSFSAQPTGARFVSGGMNDDGETVYTVDGWCGTRHRE